MKTKQVIDKHLDEFELGYWSEEDEEWYSVAKLGSEELSKKLNCSPELIDFIRFNFEDMLAQLGSDLNDIWNK